jgi:4-hydroxy-2-oxoheptanedioate aldolase
MPDIPRLNGAIRALENGQTAFTCFSAADTGLAQALGNAPYDAIVFEMEHAPYDPRLLKDCLQYMLNRSQIATSGSIAPSVTPMVRIPPNGGEMSQWFAKQVLDLGVYGVIWPHISTVEEARNAVAACRYPRPPSAPYAHPAGQRGDGPKIAAPYWGLSQADYYQRADVWPLNPSGEILVGIICEDVRGVQNLAQILDEVQGIGLVVIGEGDLSQELGFPRQYDHPAVASAVEHILQVCKERAVACGHAHVDRDNVATLLERGFRWLMTPPAYSFALLEQGRKLAGRG